MVEEIHITGSDKTHDAIVFGVGEEGARRKANREPRNTKPLSSELGNVSPIIIVPGPWSQKDLDFHGVNLASSLCNNSGFNCAATRVVIQHEQWGQREALLGSFQKALKNAEDRKPYYPGAADRQKMFVDRHPEVVRDLRERLARRTAVRPAPTPAASRLDQATRDRLRALGYAVD